MGLSISEIADHAVATLENFGAPKFQQIAQDLQKYEVMGRWLKSDRLTLSDGKEISRALMTDPGDAARNVKLFETDNVNVYDHMTNLTVPWVHAETSWGFERREALMNRGKSLITNIIKPRRDGAMITLAELLETNGWTAPASPTSTTQAYGIPYWIVKNPTTGFNGGAPSGHTTVGGVDLTAHPNFKNYTDTYTDVTKDDLITKMRTAKRKTGWESPVPTQDFTVSSNDCVVYCDENTFESFMRVGEQQNENLGRDIAWGPQNEPLFLGHPIRWVPKIGALDDDDNPVYMVDHGVFRAYVLEGDYMVEMKKDAPNQHNVVEYFIDLTYNFVCVDRRRCAVLDNA